MDTTTTVENTDVSEKNEVIESIISITVDSYHLATDWYKKNSWAIFPAYFALISFGWLIADWGYPSITAFIGAFLFAYLFRRSIHPIIISAVAALGIGSGIKNEPETMGEEAAKFSLGYLEVSTKLISAASCLPFMLIALLSFLQLKYSLMVMCIPCAIILGTYYWPEKDIYLRKISMFVSFGTIITVLCITFLTSNVAKGLGIDIGLPNWETNKAAVTLLENQKQRTEAARVKFINGVDKQLAKNGVVAPDDFKLYNELMIEIGSRQRLEKTPSGQDRIIKNPRKKISLFGIIKI